MEESASRNPGSFPGWILVTVLLLLCVSGTGLTWWNYSRAVFSTAHGELCGLVENQNKGRFTMYLSAKFPARALDLIQPGHAARITMGKNPRLMKGLVVAVFPADKATLVKIGVIRDEGSRQGVDLMGTYSVTIDTTVPPWEGNGGTGGSQGTSDGTTPR